MRLSGPDGKHLLAAQEQVGGSPVTGSPGTLFDLELGEGPEVLEESLQAFLPHQFVCHNEDRSLAIMGFSW